MKCKLCNIEFESKRRNNVYCSKKCINTAYYLRNNENIKKYYKEYYKKHRDDILKYVAEYYKKNKAKIRAYGKNYYMSNSEKAKLYYKAYNKNRKLYI